MCVGCWFMSHYLPGIFSGTGDHTVLSHGMVTLNHLVPFEPSNVWLLPLYLVRKGPPQRSEAGFPGQTP